MSAAQQPSVEIGDRTVGGDRPTFVIAEIGINHNGDVTLALDLVDVAAKTIADHVTVIQACRADGRVRNANDDDALAWLHRDAVLWAVVAAPWLLVQEQTGKRGEANSP